MDYVVQLDILSIVLGFLIVHQFYLGYKIGRIEAKIHELCKRINK